MTGLYAGTVYLMYIGVNNLCKHNGNPGHVRKGKKKLNIVIIFPLIIHDLTVATDYKMSNEFEKYRTEKTVWVTSVQTLNWSQTCKRDLVQKGSQNSYNICTLENASHPCKAKLKHDLRIKTHQLYYTTGRQDGGWWILQPVCYNFLAKRCTPSLK